MTKNTVWYQVLENKNELQEGQVMSVTAGHQVLCLSHFKGKYSALDNRCPHQGGPLGEGSIERGLLRCPWHGWEFHPYTGISPGGFDDGIQTFEVKVEGDSILVAIEEEHVHEPTISGVTVEVMVD